jgi:hypothetical protein
MGMSIRAIMDAQESNLNDTLESEVRSAAMIPIVSPHKPELIALDRPLDPALVGLWDRALKEFALATPWPTQWVVDGTGAGNHWSDWLMSEEGRKFVIYPAMRQFCALASVGCLRPILIAAGIPDPDAYELDFETSDVDTEPLTPEQAERAWRSGLLSRAAYARALGIPDEDQLDIPPDVTDWDMWLLTADNATEWWGHTSSGATEMAPPTLPGSFMIPASVTAAAIPAHTVRTTEGNPWWEN